jgi:ABC-type lipoprotein release transport system permease subunit
MANLEQYTTLIPKIAWRNVWRSRARSLVVIGAVAIGIWALIFMLGFVRGIVYGYIQKAISMETSHLQLHHPQFMEDREVRFTISNANTLADSIRHLSQVKGVSARVLVNAMVSSAHGVRGLQITGVDPEEEAATTSIAGHLVEGSYFSDGNNEIVLSGKIAEKLNTGLRKKVVVTFQNTDNNITSAAFRVVGIFESGSKQIDEMTAYVRSADILPLTGLASTSAHEIAVLLNAVDSTDTMQQRIARIAPATEVKTFRQISPDLDLFDSQIQINMIIMTIIIMLALIFGIINTMLMAVLERIRELGMLMAIGMTRIRVFFMIVWETVFVAMIGAPIGLLLGYLTMRGLQQTGIDLSMWSKGLSQFGMSTMVYPTVDLKTYGFVAAAIMVTALLASVYPSLKAIRLRPVEALRKL